MAKVRKNPTISKPLIDEEAVLRFATAAPDMTADLITISLQLKKELYASLEREANRKDRSVEEQIRKLLTKHLG